MRLTVMTGLMLAVLLAAGMAIAGPPLVGVYDSTDIGGDVNTARYTECFPSANGALLIGTTLNAESWNGSTLGSQWRYSCATQTTPPVLISSTVVNGNGFKTYMKVFTGGTIWLSGSGPWANGDVDYPGVIDAYQEFETIQYSNYVRVHAVTNIAATAHFDNYPNDCLAFTVGNGVEIGSTDFGQVKPTTYPGFLVPSTCTDTGVYGGWWDFITISLVISGCTVPAEQTSWGAIKTMYAQ